MSNIQFRKNFSSFVNTNYNISSQNTTEKCNKTKNNKVSFRDILQQKQGLVFSKHAQQRIDSRHIEVDSKLLAQINGAIESAKAKGICDALIVSNQTAFIVNVPSNTVVTTLSSKEMNSHVFTNIDGAVIL